MSDEIKQSLEDDGEWVFAKSLAEVRRAGAVMVRLSGKQIALFDTANGPRACDNRCPHEGYPLSEGTLSGDCTLTCNWHNWKFNLDTGDNLYGGDRLRTYPVVQRGDALWVNIADPPFETRRQLITTSLRDAFDEHEYDRIAREIARLSSIGGDPLDALRLAIEWSWRRMEFGWTHAYAGMADWLVLLEEYADDDELKLVCLQESVAHTAYDVLREREYPMSDETRAFDEEGFLQAVENEDEPTALSMVRGGLRNGLVFKDFESALTRAALAHYSDFGHSLIYVTKVGELIRRLGPGVAEPLLLSLVRSIIFATREDKIPEFRYYTRALAAWGDANGIAPAAASWHKCGIKKALDATVECSHAPPEVIYKELVCAAAVSMLSFDLERESNAHVTVSDNVGWLDFTHGLTFANAVRKQCTRFPDLWPQGLLQIACFCGRNAAFTTPDFELEEWRPDDLDGYFSQVLERVFDHGLGEYIVSVHVLKTALAVREECSMLSPQQASILAAALNRFMHSPLKRRHSRRTAYQSLQFVARQ